MKQVRKTLWPRAARTLCMPRDAGAFALRMGLVLPDQAPAALFNLS